MPSTPTKVAVVVAVAAVAEEAVVVVVEIITAAVDIMAVAEVAVAEEVAVAITTTMATMATTMATMATMTMVTIIIMTGTSMKPHPMEARMAMRVSSSLIRNKRLSLNLLPHLAMETKEARLAIASAGVRTANENTPLN